MSKFREIFEKDNKYEAVCSGWFDHVELASPEYTEYIEGHLEKAIDVIEKIKALDIGDGKCKLRCEKIKEIIEKAML
jgi:hypothetical protein